MAIIDWPATLPQYLDVSGFSHTLPNTVVRTEMDEGPANIRRWGTAAVEPIKGQIIINKTEVAYLRAFYNDTSRGGSLAFNWIDPYTEAAVEMRFVSPPKLSAQGSDYFTVTLDLEIMP